jgi:hypothetical protein
MVMSALFPKADMCGATRDVCFGPQADIGPISDERSNARQDNPDLGELAYRRLAAELTLTQSAPAQTGTTDLGTCYNNVTNEYAQSHLLKERLP